MNEKLWLMIGLSGQIFFSLRFLLQWIVSEIKKSSVIPVYFWYFSLIGSSFLLIYAVYRKDIVFILGQSFGLVIYCRNLILIKRKKYENIDN